MCHAQAGVAIRIDESSLRVYSLKHTDSHEKIRKHFSLRDSLSIELRPRRDFEGLENFDLVFAGERPLWWTQAHERDARAQLYEVWKARTREGKLSSRDSLILDDLEFSSRPLIIETLRTLSLKALKILPKGSFLQAESISLSELETIEDDCKIFARNFISAPSLASIERNCHLSSSGWLALSNLSSLRHSSIIYSLASLNLSKLSLVGEKVQIQCFGKLNLRNLELIPRNVSIQTLGEN